ncbi:MAG TPA: response regulator transcription factor [Thermoanaerobaculia bacterium]|nr:response regulator transcription factor [Thermoanaerobaculia bacterium]
MLVVSGDPLARAGLSLLLGGQDGIAVSGQVAPDEAWPDITDTSDLGAPHAALWDLGLGLRTGLEELRALSAGLPVVAVVADETDAREALAAGARGALSRNADGELLAAALRAATLGLIVLDEVYARSFAPVQAEPPTLAEPLTPRELEVLQRLTQGLSNKQIAQRLGVSDHTVKFHVNSILGKLGVQSRSEAIVQAVRLGLVVL